MEQTFAKWWDTSPVTPAEFRGAVQALWGELQEMKAENVRLASGQEVLRKGLNAALDQEARLRTGLRE